MPTLEHFSFKFLLRKNTRITFSKEYVTWFAVVKFCSVNVTEIQLKRVISMCFGPIVFSQILILTYRVTDESKDKLCVTMHKLITQQTLFEITPAKAYLINPSFYRIRPKQRPTVANRNLCQLYNALASP